MIMFTAGPAKAGTSALGVEIGVSTHRAVWAALADLKPRDAGVNRYSNGRMIETGGAGYEVEGLTRVLYIFDTQDKLAGVLLTLDKKRYEAVFDALAAKYKLVSQRRPFVGDRFASFRASDATVELDAPHLSFDMELRYLRTDLFTRFESQSRSEAAEKRKREAARF
jgi:hypothetical protein